MSLTAAIERLRYALKMHDEHRTTLQSLASSVGDFLRDYANIAAGQHGAGDVEQPTGEMTPERAAYFMRRFKREEKLLGPNEQAAVDYVLAMLATPQPPKPADAVPLPIMSTMQFDDGSEFKFYTQFDLRVYGDAREAAAPHALREKLRSCEEALAAAEAREAAGRAVAVPARYFADGPEGYFFADDLKLARNILNAYDHDEDWTITDLLSPAPTPQQPAAEGDDIAVDRFAEAMKAKMAAARAKGRGGWEGPTCNAEILSRMLRDHVEKGDPRDVANFCMMLWNRGEAIQANPTPAADAGGVTDSALFEDALAAAFDKYPHAQDGLTFFACAIRGPRKPTPEDIEWAKSEAAALTPEVRCGE